MQKNMIVVHCSDTPHSMELTVETLRLWHTRDNGWSDIGYNYFIDQKGEIHTGRDLDGDGCSEDEVGAHAYGFNKHSIGICLEGRDVFNDCQFDSLRWLITDIVSRHGIKFEKIVGHHDLDVKKTCPNFNVREKLLEWKK